MEDVFCLVVESVQLLIDPKGKGLLPTQFLSGQRLFYQRCRLSMGGLPRRPFCTGT